MKVNLKRPLLDFKGDPIVVENTGRNVMMHERIASVLFAMQGREKPEDLKLAYSLSLRIMQSPEELEVSAKEVSFIEEAIASKFVAGVYGQMYSALENSLK